ncbi:uncharacterized protein [Blastocystis hominis]|uniref:Protein kinase domain-containing protein n=1 Tax=Blastocystis hominis TaxID=12968 RepID=D8M6N9_BLAHO|nr:uncharacterized protein [Blastocystis hominis]CBK23457.2 unnamed protein product [Blastocystis hominis]|eukprot:XP_012897505.1 uncharacterized protein [Blastocystis hominis]
MQDERGTTAFALHRNLKRIYVNFCVSFIYMEGYYQPEISLAVISGKKYCFPFIFYLKNSPSCNIALSEICDSIISSSQSPEIRYATIRTKLDSIDSSHQPILISLWNWLNSWSWTQQQHQDRLLYSASEAYFFLFEMSSSSFAPDDGFVFKSKLCCAVDLKLEKRVVIRKTESLIIRPPNEHVVSLLSRNREDKCDLYFYEYIPGGSLCSFLLKHGPLTEKGVRKVFRQLLPLLKDESLSILPGDFRLSKILLRTSDSIDEVVLLPDDSLLMVGLGAVRSSQSENPFNLLLENMEYFSRERVLFQSFQSPQDLWSIGVLFFVLLTGSFPFGSCINSNLLTNISECRVRKEDAAYQRLSEEAKHLILRFFDPDYLKRISLDELLISEFMMVHDNADDPDYYSCDQWAFRTVPGRMANNVEYKILDPSKLKCFSFPCQGKEVDASILTNTDVIHVCEVYFGSDGFWVCVNNDSVLNPLDCPYGTQPAFQQPFAVPVQGKLFRGSKSEYMLYSGASRDSLLNTSPLCSVLIAERVITNSCRFIQLSPQTCCASRLNH